MRFERLDPDEHLYAVSGLGAGTILAPEAGLHVLEIPEEREGSRAERAHALVDVAAKQSELRAGRTSVVRRYRAEPTPLVRDAVRGYRTGRFDRVLAGDFDLF
jgi:ATP-dependent Clp protease ATP-binding subunit ClpC